jgi:TPR repeat protein
MTAYALFIGVDEYDHPDLGKLASAQADATDLHALFKRTLRYRDQATLLHSPSSEEVFLQLRRIRAELRPGDTFLLYFAGHGWEPPKGGDQLLLLRSFDPDEVPDDLSGEQVHGMPGFLALQSLVRVTGTGPQWAGVQRVFVFDACRVAPHASHRGAATTAFGNEDVLNAFARNLMPGSSRARQAGSAPPPVIIKSCRSNQKAWEINARGSDHGVRPTGIFAMAWAMVLETAADEGRPIRADGAMVADLKSEMAALSRRARLSAPQEPWISEGAGEVLLYQPERLSPAAPTTPAGTGAAPPLPPGSSDGSTAAAPFAVDDAARPESRDERPSPSPPVSLPAHGDAEFWLEAKSADTVAAYERYLTRFPEGRFRGQAQARQKEIMESLSATRLYKPAKVVWAVNILWALLGMSVLSAFIVESSVQQKALTASGGLLSNFVVSTALMNGASVWLFGWLTSKLSAGRGWVRWLMMAFGFLGAPVGLWATYTAFDQHALNWLVLQIVSIALFFSIAMLLAMPESARWFKTIKALRRSGPEGEVQASALLISPAASEFLVTVPTRRKILLTLIASVLVSVLLGARLYALGRNQPANVGVAADPQPAPAAKAGPKWGVTASDFSLLQPGNLLTKANAAARRAELEQAASAGDVEAQVLLGTLFLFGSGAEKNPDMALSFLKKSAEAGNARAMASLGVAYTFKEFLGAKSDPAVGVQWLRRGADAGDAWGMAALGHVLASGDAYGLPVRGGEGEVWARRSAESGQIYGMAILGDIYRYGRGGVPKDLPEAARWFKKASDSGLTVASVEYALMLDEGLGGLKQDRAEAVKLFRSAAEDGNPQGMFALAISLELGDGVDKNESEALVWYRKAAAAGIAEAAEKVRKLEKRK